MTFGFYIQYYISLDTEDKMSTWISNGNYSSKAFLSSSSSNTHELSPSLHSVTRGSIQMNTTIGCLWPKQPLVGTARADFPGVTIRPAAGRLVIL
jgi:hypothetical protein